MRRRLTFILIVQSILFLAHGLVFATWISFLPTARPGGVSALAIVFALLSLSFVAASALAFRYYNIFARAFYTAAAVWLGILNFLFLASIACWIVYAGARIARVQGPSQSVAGILFGIALVAAGYSVLNSLRLRTRRIDMKLPGLPPAWRGRVAALVSDTHLGPVRGAGFSRRIVSLLNRLNPHVVFLTGDFYDGTAGDLPAFAAPLKDLKAPFGSFFVTGNHEEFSDPRQFTRALSAAGVRILENETVALEGLQIAGIPYHEMATSAGFRAALRATGVNPAMPSVLLIHAPNRLWEAEQAGISLQLSGHTHRGQFFPWTLAVLRVYGKFAYGLETLGRMQVYTTCGAGTWGPPMRLGSDPEIVLFRFV